MRAHQLGQHPEVDPADVGLSYDDADDLFRLLAIARYEDRYVVPPAHAENAGQLLAQHSLSGCSLEAEGGPGMGGEGTGAPVALSAPHRRRLPLRAAAEASIAAPAIGRGRPLTNAPASHSGLAPAAARTVAASFLPITITPSPSRLGPAKSPNHKPPPPLLRDVPLATRKSGVRRSANAHRPSFLKPFLKTAEEREGLCAR
jgi:hypothetical protein